LEGNVYEEDYLSDRSGGDHRRAHLRADPRRRPHRGFGLGILDGVMVSAIISNAIANHPGYYTYDGYYGDAPYGCPYGGYWARKAWHDNEGNVRYGKPRYFCR
jgi:hypothetical protein